MLFLLFTLVLNDSIEFKDTHVYQPLLREEAKVDKQGRLYIFSFPERLISIYLSDGSFLTHIGGKGKGPGEFNCAVEFWVDGEYIFVFDLQSTKISKFNINGKFIERWDAPSRNIKLVKVDGGWFYGLWNVQSSGESVKNIMWASEKFEKKIVVCEIDDTGFSEGIQYNYTDGVEVGTYSPFESRPILLSSGDLKRAFLTDTRTFRVRILGAHEKAVVGVIEKSIPGLPFDKELANKKFEEMIDPSMRSGIKWTLNYPEKYPPICSLIVTWDGYLVANRMSGVPEEKKYILTMNPEGKEVDREWDLGYLQRVVGKFEDSVYVTLWDDDEQEARVVRLPAAKAAAFIQETAIKFDGPGGRNITF